MAGNRGHLGAMRLLPFAAAVADAQMALKCQGRAPAWKAWSTGAPSRVFAVQRASTADRFDRESPGFPASTGTWRARMSGLGVDAQVSASKAVVWGHVLGRGRRSDTGRVDTVCSGSRGVRCGLPERQP